MLASAAVAPFAFLAYTASLYAFGEGAIDEFGEQYPFPVMAGLSLLASGIYVVPALIIWVLLREGYHQKPAVPTIPSSPSRYPSCAHHVGA